MALFGTKKNTTKKAKKVEPKAAEQPAAPEAPAVPENGAGEKKEEEKKD